MIGIREKIELVPQLKQKNPKKCRLLDICISTIQKQKGKHWYKKKSVK